MAGMRKRRYTPTDEVCDGLDNNCDGAVDNNAPCPAGSFCDGANGCVQRICQDGAQRACGTDEGECQAGTQLCRNNASIRCENAVTPTDEVCDGLDNNCDGAVDNNAPCPAGSFCDGPKGCVVRVSQDGAQRACGSDEGECQQGTQLCRNNAWLGCENAVNPADEVCDGLDNNCDGAVDNNAPCPAGTFCDGAKGCVQRICLDGAQRPVVPMRSLPCWHSNMLKQCLESLRRFNRSWIRGGACDILMTTVTVASMKGVHVAAVAVVADLSVRNGIRISKHALTKRPSRPSADLSFLLRCSVCRTNCPETIIAALESSTDYQKHV